MAQVVCVRVDYPNDYSSLPPLMMVRIHTFQGMLEGRWMIHMASESWRPDDVRVWC